MKVDRLIVVIEMSRTNREQLAFAVKKLVLVFVVFWSTLSLFAQSSLTLGSSITTANPSRTGDDVFLELAYSCAGTISNCDGSSLKIDIPIGIDYVSLSNSAHIATSSYDGGTREVTFTFVDPLLAGSSGTVRVRCKFPLGVTPNNFVATFDSEISSTSTIPASESSSTSVISLANAKPALVKTLAGSAAVNTPATFKIEFCNAESYSARFGSLNFSSVRIEDVLPIGAVFISGETETSGVVTTYDSGTRIITSTVGNLLYGDCVELYYTIQYDTPTHSLGDMVTNTAEVFYTAVGESQAGITDGVVFQLQNASVSVTLNKELAANGPYRQGQFGAYILEVSNAGSSPAADFQLVDVIPSELIVQSILTGQWFDGPGVISDELVIEYQTNLNSSWVAMPPNPTDIRYSRRVYVSDLGLATNERISMLRWSFASYTTAFDWVAPARIFFQVDPTAVVGSTITNCLSYTTTSSGANPAAEESCESFLVIAAETQPVIKPQLSKITSSDLDVGDRARMVGYLANEDITIAPLSSFWGACILPKGFEVDLGNVSISYYNSFAPKSAPTISFTPNYGDSENSLFKVDWTGTGEVIEPGESISVDFFVSPTDDAPAGSGNVLTWMVGGDEASICASGFSNQADVLDVNDNGNATEQFCYAQRSISVVPRIETQAEIEVKGELDVTWTKFPANGESLPGGIADYQVSVRNTGNVALEDVIIIDILPHLGDLGVIDPQPRNSAWSPNLAGPVDAPSGVVVQYSTEGNPCRAADGFLASDPAGCQVPNWSTLPPSDITQVKSIRFVFGSTLIEPQTEFSFSWPMRTPVNVLSQPGVAVGDLAWNSFGFVANRADNGAAILPAEPVKTGIALNALAPGVVGDFIWSDSNGNGIQDALETGINGIHVELYQDNGDGVADPEVDALVSFTISADGGYYLFPNLSSGSYFVWFVKPPTYVVSAAFQGGDSALDSDVSPHTKDGIAGAITDVFSITDTDFDYSRDLGLSPSGNGAIGNYTWIDRNLDGIQNEPSKDGANGIQVDLYTALGALVASTYSADDSFGKPGYYLFDNVVVGSYFLEFSHNTSPVITSLDVGDDTFDSDANTANGRTSTFMVVPAFFDQSWDCGFDVSGVEDCNNGLDDDFDGLIDCMDEECPKGNSVTRILGL